MGVLRSQRTCPWSEKTGIASPKNRILVDRLAAERPHLATEIPSGRPQIRYFPEADQWVPRGGVVRCVVESDEAGQAVIRVDGRELSLAEFGRLLTTYAGWGMRIEFTPEDAIDRRPQLVIRDPEER
jgi:hypothetical protein